MQTDIQGRDSWLVVRADTCVREKLGRRVFLLDEIDNYRDPGASAGPPK